MSIKTQEDSIKAAIEALDYVELPGNLRIEDDELPDNFHHRAYSLYTNDVETVNFTSSGCGGAPYAELKVVYTIGEDSKSETELFDEYWTLVKGLDHEGFFEDPSKEVAEGNNKKIICSSKFYIGTQ